MLRPFAAHPTLIGLILQSLKDRFGSDKIVLATTQNALDDELVPEAEKRGIKVYRGSENDVLERFIGAAEEVSLTHLVRICADNPFLSMDFISELIEKGIENPQADYISWFFPDGRPTIRSHSGFFAEWTKVDALRSIRQHTEATFFHEHITSFFFDRADIFDIVKMQVPADRIEFYRNTRLTIDTISDFEIAETIYKDLVRNKEALNPESVYQYLLKHPDIQTKMTINISQNEK